MYLLGWEFEAPLLVSYFRPQIALCKLWGGDGGIGEGRVEGEAREGG